MAGCSRSLDVKFALERAKKKISGLEHKLSALGTVSGGEEEVKALPWTQSKELKDSLVDMYKGPGNMEAAAVPSPAPFVQTATKDHAPFLQSDSGGHAHCGLMDSRRRLRNISWERSSEPPHNSSLKELCAAQRDRDQALMSRLHLANEERDEALLRAKRLQQAAEGMEDITSEFNMDVEEVLCGLAVADSARSVQQGGAVLLALLQKARQRRHDITTQEMMVLIDERDHTATKAEPGSFGYGGDDEGRGRPPLGKEELERAERERDEVVEQNQRLKEQLRANTRLHSETRQDLSSKPSQTPVPGDGGSVLGTDPGRGPLVSPLQQQDVQHQLQISLQAEREAFAKIHKLERLVEVLRKKVGTGNLRSVI
ncbi:unnamed protein product [Merluccius merluccius]